MEIMSHQRDPLELLIGHRDALLVVVLVKLGTHGQAGPSRGPRDEIHHDLVTLQAPASPVHRNMTEQPVLYLVPLGCAAREMNDRDIQTELLGERRELSLPQPDAVPIRPSTIRRNQQPSGIWIGNPTHRIPPAPDRLHRELGSVSTTPNIHPTSVSGHVIHPVRDSLTEFLVRKGISVNFHGLAHWPPFLTTRRKIAQQLLLLRINTDHRLASSQELRHHASDVPKLGIPVRMVRPFLRLHRRLQAVPRRSQQPTNARRTDGKPTRHQIISELPKRLRRPPQRALRIPTSLRLHQTIQRLRQTRLNLFHTFPPRTRRTDPR